MENHYCEYCGIRRHSIQALTTSFCSKNPDGKYHSLFEGSERSTYSCKYCGISRNSIANLVAGFCSKNPEDKYHTPSLNS